MEYTFECQKCSNNFTKKVDLFDTEARHQAKKAFHECPKCVRKSNKKQNIADDVITIELRKRGIIQ